MFKCLNKVEQYNEQTNYTLKQIDQLTVEEYFTILNRNMKIKFEN